MRIIVLLCVCFLVLCIPAAEAGDTQPPTVAITQPTNGSTLSGVVTVTASATDDVGVTSVSFLLDGAAWVSPLASPPFNVVLDTANYTNGVHTLLAIARDVAGNVGRSDLVQITVTNPRYTLSSGPFTVENLGSVLSVNTEQNPVYFQLSNNTHFLLYYMSDYGVSQLQILDVNLSQRTARLTNSGSLGRASVRGTVLYPNGNIYGSSGEANGLGFFFEYNPTTGATRQIAQTTGSDPGQYNEIGDDGWIYIGGFPNAFVDRYNPNTDTYQRLGSMDGGPAGADYAYTLGADTRYLYVGLGELPWSLAIYDTQASTITHYWATEGDTYGAVRHSTDGKWYYVREGPATTNTGEGNWYQLVNGVPVLTTYTLNSPPPNLYVENAQRGNVVDGVANGYLVGYEVNLDDALPDSTSNYATIRWRPVGATDWQSVGIGGFHLAPLGISRLYPWDSTHLLGFSSFYGPVYLWDINSHQTTRLGYPQFNLYDAVFGQGVAYFCGYTAGQLRYDPFRPWTLVASTANKFDTTINPYQTPLAIGKHEYFEAFGSDGMVYVAAMHERDSVGGELGWYDPAAGTIGSLRTPFLNDEPADLKPALGGTKLVYASTGSNLFVFDVATKTIERTIVPLPGITMDKVVEVDPGIMFGAAGNNIFEVDITNGSVIYSQTLPDKAFQESMRVQNNRLVLGPDGYIWMFRWYRDAQYFNRSSLYRINPADGSSSVIVADTFYTYGENNLMFNGGDMYWYGGMNLYRVANILVPTDILYGDVSGDGQVTAYDAALALRQGMGSFAAAQVAQRAVGLL